MLLAPANAGAGVSASCCVTSRAVASSIQAKSLKKAPQTRHVCPLGRASSERSRGELTLQTAAIGIVAASGHARPLVAGDKFAGFCVDRADNANGSAADIRVRCRMRGEVELP